MVKKFKIQTQSESLHDITRQVEEVAAESSVEEGICVVYCPHTTAAITINENADPDVVTDLLTGLNKAFPDRAEFRHGEGNSAAHLKASCIGASETLIVSRSRLLLGTWQGIYFCEFDGPRQRSFYVTLISG